MNTFNRFELSKQAFLILFPNENLGKGAHFQVIRNPEASKTSLSEHRSGINQATK
jgi:hypothetical protein